MPWCRFTPLEAWGLVLGARWILQTETVLFGSARITRLTQCTSRICVGWFHWLELWPQPCRHKYGAVSLKGTTPEAARTPASCVFVELPLHLQSASVVPIEAVEGGECKDTDESTYA